MKNQGSKRDKSVQGRKIDDYKDAPVWWKSCSHGPCLCKKKHLTLMRVQNWKSN